MEALAMALVTALATKAFEKFGEKTGENISNTATELVKSLFKPDELITLNLSAEHLSQPDEQEKLVKSLETRLPNNPDVAQQLQALLEALQAAEKGDGGNFSGQTNFGKVVNNVGEIKEIKM